MLIRKNISLDEKYLKKLQPLLDLNDGNLSAAIRDTIEVTDAALENHKSVEAAVKYLKESSFREEEKNILFSKDNVTISRIMFSWLLQYTKGRLLDEGLVNELINPFEIHDMNELEMHLNNLCKNYHWLIKTSITCEDPLSPDSAQVLFSNSDINGRDFFAQHVALFLAKWKHLDIDHIFRRANSTQVFFKKNLAVSPNDIMPGIRKHFGYMDIVCKEIDDNPDFWMQLMYTYNVERYNLVTLHRNQFETFAAGEAPNPTKILERLSRRSISEMDLPELLLVFKRMYLATQLVKNIEICLEPGKESVMIFHDFKNEKVISNLIQYFSHVFEEYGAKFTTSSYASMIVFRFGKEGSPSEASHLRENSDFCTLSELEKPDFLQK